MELVQQLIADYGYLAIFLMLVLGIVGLPIPDEVMMTVVGYFTHTDVLNYELSILISFVGALLGMLISYMIGRKAGRPFIDKYGKWVGLKEKKNDESGKMDEEIRSIFSYFRLFYSRRQTCDVLLFGDRQNGSENVCCVCCNRRLFMVLCFYYNRKGYRDYSCLIRL